MGWVVYKSVFGGCYWPELCKYAGCRIWFVFEYVQFDGSDFMKYVDSEEVHEMPIHVFSGNKGQNANSFYKHSRNGGTN